MNVLSIFDGVSCGQIALNNLGIPYDKYYASEIDKIPISVSMKNYPNTIQLGDVKNINTSELDDIFLMIGGSPCINFSFAGKMKGMATKDNIEITSLNQYLELKDKGYEFEGQSYLFWEYVRILKEVKPKYFLLENVRMVKKWENVITEIMGVEGIHINSSLIGAQNRRRIYWTNIPNVILPEDKNICLTDILDDVEEGIKIDFVDDEYILTARNGKKIRLSNNVEKPYSIYESRTEFGKQERARLRKELGRDTTPRNKEHKEYLPLKSKKANCLLTSLNELDYFLDKNNYYRTYTVNELCRLQNLPLDYFDSLGLSKNQIRKCIGNGWSVDVISHIFSFIKN